jgi:dUTP pyrophosphatase
MPTVTQVILSSRAMALQNIIQNIYPADIQTQPCGVDLTLKRVLIWKSSGVVDFDNSRRKIAETETIPFQPDPSIENPAGPGFVDLHLDSTWWSSMRLWMCL